MPLNKSIAFLYAKIRRLAENSNVIIKPPIGNLTIRSCGENGISCTSGADGEAYYFEYKEIDLVRDKFFSLTEVKIDGLPERVSKVRWVSAKNDFETNPRIDAFLEEIENVFMKHGLLISHEDTHGSFVIVDASKENVNEILPWLQSANDNTTRD